MQFMLFRRNILCPMAVAKNGRIQNKYCPKYDRVEPSLIFCGNVQHQNYHFCCFVLEETLVNTVDCISSLIQLLRYSFVFHTSDQVYLAQLTLSEIVVFFKNGAFQKTQRNRKSNKRSTRLLPKVSTCQILCQMFLFRLLQML